MTDLNMIKQAAFKDELQKIAADFDEKGNLVNHSIRNALLGAAGLGAGTAGAIMLHKKLFPPKTFLQKTLAGMKGVYEGGSKNLENVHGILSNVNKVTSDVKGTVSESAHLTDSLKSIFKTPNEQINAAEEAAKRAAAAAAAIKAKFTTKP